MTIENTETNTDVENPRLIELKSEIYRLNTSELTEPLQPSEFDPALLKIISKMPEWLSRRANNLVNEYIDLLDIKVGDIVRFYTPLYVLDHMQKVTAPVTYEGYFSVTGFNIYTGVEYFEIMNQKIMRVPQNKHEMYRDYLKTIDKVYSINFRHINEDSKPDCLTFYKKVTAEYNSNDKAFQPANRWERISYVYAGYMKHLDTISNFSDIYKLTCMSKT